MEQYEYIAHHGIKGMRWGVRNYQNEDGSLTPLGRARYGISGGIFDSTSTLASRAKRGLKSVATSARVAGVVAKGHASRALESGLKKASTSARVNEIIAKGRTARALDRSGVSDAFESTRHAIARGMVAAGNARSSIERLLSTQSAEAERIRAYTDALKRERTLKISMANLTKQREYLVRKEAGRRYLSKLPDALNIVGVESAIRFMDRTGVGRKDNSLTGIYRRARSFSKRMLDDDADAYSIASRTVNELVDEYSRMGLPGSYQRERAAEAARWWKVARGR